MGMKSTRLGARWSTLIALFAVSALSCSDDDDSAPGESPSALTYYQDILPILEDHCLGCHQEGGIGRVRLGDYAVASQYAAAMAIHTKNRTMPPWSAVSDGSCGEFRGSLWLEDAAIDAIGKWASSGAKEGTPKAVNLPDRPQLETGTDFSTPVFTPEVEGGALAENDEYRCFLLDSGVTQTRFITEYDVHPGVPEVVHHALAFIVDPTAPAAVEGRPDLTNGELMASLDAESPNRDGWPCFGMAGEGVNVSSVPVIWTPGQGVVRYPDDSGIPLSPTDKVVIQVHYNLVDAAQRGKSDETIVRFTMKDSVTNVGFFAVYDALLGSLLSGGTPDVLEARRPSVKYTWGSSVEEMGLGSVPQLKLYGLLPHMHERGHRYNMTLKAGAGATKDQCGVQIDDWDFHWQRMYFYESPLAVTAESVVQVTCDYDTSGDTEPTLPGWGTRNEMCFAALYFTAPMAALAQP